MAGFLSGLLWFSMGWLMLCPEVRAENYVMKTLSLDEGLSQPTVRCTARDSKGYLWIATKGGLNRYDPGEMKVYRHNPADGSSLPDNDVLKVFEDDRGTIWVVCVTGIATYNRKDDCFETMRLQQKALRARSYLLMPSGVMFGGAGTLFFYDYDAGDMTERLVRGGSDRYYTAIHPWTRNNYLLATRWDGLWLYDTEEQTVERFGGFNRRNIMASMVDTDGNLWLSNYGDGLWCLERTGVLTQAQIPQLIPDGIVLDLMEASGRLWIATDGRGLLTYDLYSGDTQRVDNPDEPYRGLRSVNSLYCDRAGFIYAGTVRDGLTCLHPSPLKTIGRLPGYSPLTVTSVLADRDGVWLGIDGDGLAYCDHLRNDALELQPATAGMKIVSMAQLDGSRVMLSTFDNGLFIYDRATRRIAEAPAWASKLASVNRRTGLPLDLVTLPGERLAALTDHILLFDSKTGKTTVLRPPNASTARLREFYHDMRDMMCMTDHDIYMVDLTRNNMRQLANVGRDIVECAAYDGNRYIYVATSNGMKRYDFDTGRIEGCAGAYHWPQRVTAMAINDGKLWMGAPSGLYVADLSSGTMQHLGATDGVDANEFIYKAVLNSGRQLYMGGVNGLLKVDLDGFDAYIDRRTDMSSNLVEVSADGMMVQPIDGDINVPADHSQVRLRFANNSAHPMDDTPMRLYIGRNNSRSPIESNSNVFTLGHIKSDNGGRYDLYASTVKTDGSWSDPKHVGTIVVPGPWWRHPAVMAIGSALMVLLLVALFLYARQRRRSALERTADERRRHSLEKEVGFLINLNYELRTPLTLIYSRLKRLTEKPGTTQMPQDEVREELDKIYKSTSKMCDIINTTVDLWRSGEFKTDDSLRRVDAGKWLRGVMDDVKKELSEKKLQLHMESTADAGEMVCDPRGATIAMQTVLTTAVRHAREHTDMNITTWHTDSEMFLGISFLADDSHGIEEEVRYARHLLALQEGDVTIATTPNGITTITVSMPREMKKSAKFNAMVPGSDMRLIENDSKETHEPEDKAEFDMSHLSVIIVEDDPELRAFMAANLAPMFKKVIEVSNGKDALTTIKNTNPDLIITEARLPQMSGLELCRTIKNTRQYSHIPVIMLTTRLEEMSIANGNNFGADNYVTKPFDIDILERRCVSVLRSFDRIKQWYRSQAPELPTVSTKQSNDAEAFLLNVRKIIEENISQPGFTVDTIVDEMLVSRSTLYTRFKELTGQSLGSYINDYKLKLAKQMLCETELTMNEIADALGFSTQRYFSTFFKDKTGQTPTAFRSENAKQPASDQQITQ